MIRIQYVLGFDNICLMILYTSGNAGDTDSTPSQSHHTTTEPTIKAVDGVVWVLVTWAILILTIKTTAPYTTVPSTQNQPFLAF